MATTDKYIPLDTTSSQTLGLQQLSFTSGQASASFLPTTTLITNLFLLAIFTAGAVRVAYLYLVRSASSDSEVARSTFNKAFTTIVVTIFLSASLVLIGLAVNPDLVTGNISLAGITGNPVAQQTTTQTTPTSATPAVSSGGHSPEADARIRKRLAESNITINNPYPTTMVDGMTEETIQMLLKLNGSCKCQVVITGGTEPGHQTHGIGKRPVDLRLVDGDALYTYIKNTSRSLGPRTGVVNGVQKTYCVAQYKPDWTNYVFCDEPSNPNKTSGARHWHVN